MVGKGQKATDFTKEAKSKYLPGIVLVVAPTSTGYRHLLLFSVGGRISSKPQNLAISPGLWVQEISEMGHLDLWKD